MNKYYIYCHINLINNKKYIGLTKQKPEDRWKNGLGYKRQEKFFNAILKYGWDNFSHEIVKDKLTAHEAGALEKELIKKYNTINNGYNVSPGGEITNHSQETLEKMRQSMLGKKHTEETKKKISQAKQDDKKPVLCITTNTIYESGAEASKITGIDASSISKCCQGIALTAGKMEWRFAEEDESKKYALIKANNKNKSKKPVECLTTGKIYESVSDAAKDTNSDASNITKVCNGKYKTTNGLKWRFL